MKIAQFYCKATVSHQLLMALSYTIAQFRLNQTMKQNVARVCISCQKIYIKIEDVVRHSTKTLGINLQGCLYRFPIGCVVSTTV